MELNPVGLTIIAALLKDFTVDTFAGRVGERFRIKVDEATAVDAELVEAAAVQPTSGVPVATPGGRTPFSIVFRGPQEPLLPQSIYPFEHAELGAFEIFIVPIGRDADGVRYEAIFT